MNFPLLACPFGVVGTAARIGISKHPNLLQLAAILLVKFQDVTMPDLQQNFASLFKSKTIWWKTICQQANLAASQFGRKVNKNDLPLLALKQQQKSFVMSQRQLKRQCKCSGDMSENFNLKLLNVLNLGMFLTEYLSI